MVKNKDINLMRKLIDDYRINVTDDSDRSIREPRQIIGKLNEALSRAELPERIIEPVKIPVSFEHEGKFTRPYTLIVQPSSFFKPGYRPYIAVSLEDM